MFPMKRKSELISADTMKLILSTGNIVSGGPSILRKPGTNRSNLELTNSLRSSFLTAQSDAVHEIDEDANENEKANENGNGNDNEKVENNNNNNNTTDRRPPLASWTQHEADTLYIPRVTWPTTAAGGGSGGDGHASSASSNNGGGSSGSDDDDSGVFVGAGGRDHYHHHGVGLQEEASQYETTIKLFFLPQASVAARGGYADEAVRLVCKQLGVEACDLLVVSFPGLSFDGDCEWRADKLNSAQGDDDAEVATWQTTAEMLHGQGRAKRLGVAEFGGEKLARFLGRVTVPPTVDQINMRDCCNVPPPLVELAAERGVQLFAHSDCTDILPPGTLRQLLGPQGAGVLDEAVSGEKTVAAAGAAIEEGHAKTSDALHGDIVPLWVAKYTAVVRDRGVIESKGYFAGAELRQG